MTVLDSFLLLTPVLMLAVVALLVFVGCYTPVTLQQPPSLNVQAVPGIPPPNTRITPVDVTWNTDADTKVERATAASGPFAIVGETSSGSFTDASVTDGTTYFYQVDAGSNGFGGPVSVTPQPPFVSSFLNLGAPASNIDGFLGMAITVAGNPVTVYALGRLMAPGNSAVHEIRIVDASNSNTLASVMVNMAGGTVGSFVYSALSSPVGLNADGSYYVVSQEMNGGDQWHMDNTTLITTTVATVTSSIIGRVAGSNTNYTVESPGMVSFGPLDFLYL